MRAAGGRRTAAPLVVAGSGAGARRSTPRFATGWRAWNALPERPVLVGDARSRRANSARCAAPGWLGFASATQRIWQRFANRQPSWHRILRSAGDRRGDFAGRGHAVLSGFAAMHSSAGAALAWAAPRLGVAGAAQRWPGAISALQAMAALAPALRDRGLWKARLGTRRGWLNRTASDRTAHRCCPSDARLERGPAA